MSRKYNGAIFELDGVLINTTEIHAKAWKQMFDIYNQRRKEKGQEPFEEFREVEDTPFHMKDKHHYDGVESFLKSKGIEIPYGTPADDEESETICGLGNLKNEYYRSFLKEADVSIIPENVKKAREWKYRGLKIGVVTSVKSSKAVKEIPGLEDLFDVCIDSEEQPGRDVSQMMLNAARKMEIDPQKIVVIDESLSGIEAARKCGFNLVIGINDGDNKDNLLENGADIVLPSLEEFDLFSEEDYRKKYLPSAIDNMDKIIADIRNNKTLICLDYDGTLTPIISDYKNALLSEEMHATLKSASEDVPVAVVSGRDISFIKEKVNLDNVFYAGSHGYQIEGPDGFEYKLKESSEILPHLNDAERDLKKRTKLIKGVEIERKEYAIAIHYRHVHKDDIEYLENVVSDILQEYPRLKRGGGKKIIELKPNIDWHKGKAMNVLREAITPGEDSMVIYVGDDETDEDAFKAIKKGYGIYVGHPGQETAASYYFRDVEEVGVFLGRLTQ